MATLTGVRVVSMALNVPGPLAAARLRDAGASVIKVEPPAGDPLEELCPSWYSELHRDMPVERLDLKSDEGRTRMGERLERAQLFLSSQRPSALARLRLDAPSIAADARTAHIRTLNIVGETAHPERAGHDLTYSAGAGLLSRELPRTLIADVLGSERAFAAALILLREPEGSHAQVGLVDSLDSIVAPLRHGLTDPGGPLNGGLAAYGLYDARDGRIAVAALEPHFRERLYRALGRPLDSALTDAFLSRTADEWEQWARERDLPISAIRD
jgi:crotonobetainyl-CoA:carnitine CoA-transferase CaiB-like acyl-CoA transferase